MSRTLRLAADLALSLEATTPLKTRGLLAYPGDGTVVLTSEGRAVARTSEISSLDELHDLWFRKLSPSEGRLLRTLVEVYPRSVSRAALADATGYTVNGHFNNMVGHLRTAGAVAYPGDGSVVAADVLFPEGWSS